MTRQRKISGWPFKAEMIRANKEGRKTESRRTRGLQKVNEEPDNWELSGLEISQDENQYYLFDHKYNKDVQYSLKCPYGQKGDILYAKETYQQEAVWKDWDGTNPLGSGWWESTGRYVYRADGVELPADTTVFSKWRPSIFMPKDVARIWMEVVDSYPERIQDITEEGAKSEGVEKYRHAYRCYDEKPLDVGVYDRVATTAKYSFKTLIKSINGPEMWDRNEWVWVVKYKILSTTGKPDGI